MKFLSTLERLIPMIWKDKLKLRRYEEDSKNPRKASNGLEPEMDGMGTPGGQNCPEPWTEDRGAILHFA